MTERRLPGDEVGVCVSIMKGHEKTSESNTRVHCLDCGEQSTGITCIQSHLTYVLFIAYQFYLNKGT